MMADFLLLIKALQNFVSVASADIGIYSLQQSLQRLDGNIFYGFSGWANLRSPPFHCPQIYCPHVLWAIALKPYEPRQSAN